MHLEKLAPHQPSDSEAREIAAEWLSNNRFVRDALVLSMRKDAARKNVFALQLWLSLFRNLERELENHLAR